VPKDKITLMIELVTASVIENIIEEKTISAKEAMRAFYNSEVFNLLCNSETGLYRESGGYVYDLFKIECENGRLIPCEI